MVALGLSLLPKIYIFSASGNNNLKIVGSESPPALKASLIL